MTDIVERLSAYVIGDQVYHPLICSEAADEIERLREALRLCKQDLSAAFRNVEQELAFSEAGRPALPSTERPPTENIEGRP